LGDGSDLGVRFEYAEQSAPRGLAEAFIIGETFIGGDRVALVLGDNIFYGFRFTETLANARNRKTGATVFAYPVSDPERYGVIDFDAEGKALSIEEKPKQPKSRFAVPGLYFYDTQVVEIAKATRPSPRGELEITDVNRTYLEKGELYVEKLSRGFAWLDTGTHSSLLQAGHFVQTIEERQGLKIGCLDEIAFGQGFIDQSQLLKNASSSPAELKKYLEQLID
jgi:glucose-1-phosphate thymidylyltransferase